MLNSNLALTNDDIEEELVNNDLLNSGGVENEIVLKDMTLKEKKDLLRQINNSKEFHNEPSSSVLENSSTDLSSSNFPVLSEAEKRKSEKKLKLPRKQPSTSKATDSEDNSSDVVDRKFNLPLCLDDGALPLPMPDRPTRHIRTSYCVMKGETLTEALKRMLADHDKWKEAYIAELSRLALEKDIEDTNSLEQKHSPTPGTAKDDPYHFVPDQDLKDYPSLRNKEYNVTCQGEVTFKNRKPRTLQRKTSRDSDCEEVEPIIKPLEKRGDEWVQVTTQKKRNRKQSNSQDKGRPKSVDEKAQVEFDFDQKWEGQTSGWRSSQSPSLSGQNNQIRTRRNLSSTIEVQEQMVECPICQKRFAQSKVENHAATCEGYPDSPMEVE